MTRVSTSRVWYSIKCLSLFFLDEVKNYRRYDAEGKQVLGRYGEIFEQEYMNAYNEARNIFDPDYMSYLAGISAGSTHAGYFSIDKKGHAVNSETKGSMSTLDLREIEKGKIACAEKLFRQLSNSQVKYGQVDSFNTLMQLVK